MADEMNDAGVNNRLRKDGVDRLGKPFNPSTTAISTSLMPRFFSSFMTAARTWRLRCFDPKVQDIPRSIPMDAERNLDRLVAHQALAPDFDPQCIELASRGRFCHSLTVFRTASDTVEIRSGETSSP